MAIDTATLKSTLKDLFSQANSADEAANGIAEALETWIKTATVQVTAAPGDIAVTGSPSGMANPSAVSISGDPSTMTGGIS